MEFLDLARPQYMPAPFGRDFAAERAALSRLLAAALLKVCLALMLCQTALLAAAPGNGEKASPLERSVKAAFLYKFLNYVEWPAAAAAAGSPNAPMVIGVVGADDIAAELTKVVQDRNVNGRPVTVKRLQDGDTAAGLQLLFIGGTDPARLDRWLKQGQMRGILTVTESDDEARTGVINFVQVDGRIRFDISLEAAEKNNVKLSSRMLSVARVVQKGAP
jgi:hypothetical protein